MGSSPSPIPQKVTNGNEFRYAQEWLGLAADLQGDTPKTVATYERIWGKDHTIVNANAADLLFQAHSPAVQAMCDSYRMRNVLETLRTWGRLEVQAYAQAMIVSSGHASMTRGVLESIRRGWMEDEAIIKFLLHHYRVRITGMGPVYKFEGLAPEGTQVQPAAVPSEPQQGVWRLPPAGPTVFTAAALAESANSPAAVGPDPSTVPSEPSDLQVKAAMVGEAIANNRRLEDLEVAIRVVQADIESFDALKRMGPAVTAQKTVLVNYLFYLRQERDELKAKQPAIPSDEQDTNPEDEGQTPTASSSSLKDEPGSSITLESADRQLPVREIEHAIQALRALHPHHDVLSSASDDISDAQWELEEILYGRLITRESIMDAVGEMQDPNVRRYFDWLLSKELEAGNPYIRGVRIHPVTGEFIIDRSGQPRKAAVDQHPI